MSNTRTKVQQIVTELNNTYMERKDMIDCMILAVLSKEHMAAIGSPGTAKSLMARDLMSRFTDARWFETILSRVTLAEAVLGPLDLPLLRDTGAFIRKSEHYLPCVEFAFIDEAFKSSPVLQHSLLSILNERKIHEVRDGASVHDVPLHTAFMASNEIPEEDESGAFWDRIVLRCQVEYLKSGGNFGQLFDMRPAGTTTVSWVELQDAIENEISEIPIPPKVIDTLYDIREKLRAHTDPTNPDGIVLSDRRWAACAKILRAQAWIRGRDIVNEIDLLALKHVLWTELSQIDVVERILIAHADRISDQIRTLKDNVLDLHKGITERKGHSKEQRSDHATHTLRKAKAIRQELIRLETEHPGHPEIQITVNSFERMWTDMFTVLLDKEPPVFGSWWKQQ